MNTTDRAFAAEWGKSDESVPESAEPTREKPCPYGPLALFLRACARMFLFYWDTSLARSEGICVYIVHHRNLSGPIHTLLLMPDMPRPWVLHVFLERKSCFEQYYGYTFTKRFHWPKPLAWAAATVLSWVVPVTLRSFGAIPVYRGLREMRRTMDETQAALARGESVLLCPDVDYDSGDDATGAIYKGFLRLEKPFYEKTDRHLRFVPVLCARTKRIATGEAVCFPDGVPYRAAREDTARRLVDGLNALAALCESAPDTQGKSGKRALEEAQCPTG